MDRDVVLAVLVKEALRRRMVKQALGEMPPAPMQAAQPAAQPGLLRRAAGAVGRGLMTAGKVGLGLAAAGGGAALAHKAMGGNPMQLGRNLLDRARGTPGANLMSQLKGTAGSQPVAQAAAGIAPTARGAAAGGGSTVAVPGGLYAQKMAALVKEALRRQKR